MEKIGINAEKAQRKANGQKNEKPSRNLMLRGIVIDMKYLGIRKDMEETHFRNSKKG